MPIAFRPTDFEALLTWNDDKTLEKWDKYVEEKKQKELEEQRLLEEKKKLEEERKTLKNVFMYRKKYRKIMTSEDYMKYLKEGDTNYE